MSVIEGVEPLSLSIPTPNKSETVVFCKTTKPMSAARLLSLPDEVLIHLLSYLDIPELFTASRVGFPALHVQADADEPQ